MTNIKQLIVLRGLPGSGKSTFANFYKNNLHPELSSIICSADSFLYENNEYIWTKERVIKAHEKCFQLAEESMINNINIIILDNTNIKSSDYKYYRKIARKYNYEYVSLIIENIHNTKSIHNVNKETLNNQRKNFTINL